MKQHVCATKLAATRMPQVNCHDGAMRVASCQRGPNLHAYMSWAAPCAPRQRQKQLALPPDQEISDTRPRAGGLNYYKILVGGGGPSHNVKRRFNMQMGISSGWARAPHRQQHSSRACHCKTFVQRNRFTHPRVNNMEPSLQQWGAAAPPAQCR